MPQAAPLAFAWVVVGAAELEGLAEFGVLAAGTLLSAGVSSQMAKVAKHTVDAGGLLVNTRSTEDRVRVIYGTRRVGGTLVFWGLSGTNHDDLWLVLDLGEGPCDSIAQVDGVDQIWFGDELWTTFGGNVTYTFHAGSTDQVVDTDLNAALPEWTDNRHHRCYIVFKLHFDPDYFQSLPTITVLLKGRTLYDIRTDTTAYSANPVLCRYDYMTSTRYGMAVPAEEIDLATFGAAANYCDAKLWECHYVLDGDIMADDVLDAIDVLYRGQQVWWNGKYYLRYADLNYETTAKELTDELVARDESGKLLLSMKQPSGLRKPDGYKVKYTDPVLGYVPDTVLVGETDGYIQEIDLSQSCTNRQHAAVVGTYLLERARLDRVIEGTFRDDCVELEPNDIVTGTFEALGITGQYLRVIDSTWLNDGKVQLTMIYESTNLYNDIYDIAEDEVYTCSMPKPYDAPPGVGNAVVTEEIYQYRLRSEIRLNISYDLPTGYPWLDYVDVWLSFDNITWTYLFPVTGRSFVLGPVEEGKIYYIRIKTVSIHGRRQDDVADYRIMHTVLGVSAIVPASLSSLDVIVSGNAVNMWATRIDTADVLLFEYRLGSTWNGAIFLASLSSPNFSLQGVKPGTHTFLCNVKGTNGFYGETPSSQNITLVDPPDGWSAQASQAFDYSSGTFSNAELVTYSGDPHLKCSHTAGILTGSWKSPVIDRLSSLRQLVYALAGIVITGAGTTWDDLVPSPDTWDDLDVSRTWEKIFQLSAGPSVAMNIYYGDTNPPTMVVGRMEILYAVLTARYYQLEIVITDPSDAVITLVEAPILKFCQAS